VDASGHLAPVKRVVTEPQVYGASADRIYEACVRTVAQLGWKLQHSDSESRTLSCAARGRKIRPGGGQDLSIFVEQIRSDRARITLGWGYQVARLFDHGEKAEIGGLFYETLDVVLPKVKTRRASDSREATAVDLASQLERLADLHAHGRLTDSEFQDAKARLLRR
jgi:hypothetical protein